jgi:hypothetical protein
VLVNIYSSNDGEKRVAFWNWMVNELSEAPWFVCGDFNMVENPEDKEGLSLVQIP